MKLTKTILFSSLALMGLGNNANAQIINTIAGDGTAGYSGDGGAATSAQMEKPYGVCVDLSGNVYFADNFNHRIRKISTTGIITTIAGIGNGNGTFGYSGDGGPAISAQLYFPNGICIDKAGDLLIADVANQRIRKVSATTGIISTIAGNGIAGYSGDGVLATSTRLGGPNGVSVDDLGNLYIAELGNDRIRKIDVTTGIISTIAGNGTQGYSGDGGQATSAQLHNPGQVTVDASGNVYISDSDNNRIRKINASTGIISTIAGNGTQGYSGDGGQATSAELYYPTGLCLDANRNIYFADFYNNRIRKINATTGIISTIAGIGGYGSFSGDGGLATNANIYDPTGVFIDALNNIYLSDTDNNRIRKISNATGIEQFTDNSSQISVYPNPFNLQTTIGFSEVQKNTTIKIMDVLGKEVKAFILNGEKNLLIEKGEMKAGIYFVQVIDESFDKLRITNVVNKKIVIQ